MSKYSIAVKGKQYCFPSASGIGIPLPGYFAGINATFGFNSTPHKFSIDIVKETDDINDVNLNDLPQLETEAQIYIGSKYFLAAGRVTHASYSKSMGGVAIKIEIQDKRRDLDAIFLHTDDIEPPTVYGNMGLVSIPTYLRKTYPNIVKTKEFDKVLKEGATYTQIYEALINSPSTMWGNINLVASGMLPTPTVMASNVQDLFNTLDVSFDTFRWKFNGTTLRAALTTICDTLGFDWYWSLEHNKVFLINRSLALGKIGEEYLADFTDEETISFDWGIDSTDIPYNYALIGAKQEGFVDSKLLSPIDGLLTPSGLKFVSAWDKMSVAFFDADGVRRSYIPSDRELSMSAKGIEIWAYYKKYQEDDWGDPPDAGSIAAQHQDFQSKFDDKIIDIGSFNYIMDDERYFSDPTDTSQLTGDYVLKSTLNAATVTKLEARLDTGDYYNIIHAMDNRRDRVQNWIIEWFNKISSQVKTHYGRTFVASGIYLRDETGYFDIIDKAWCNIENQLDISQSGFYGNYLINTKYNPLSPFVKEDYRVSAHAVLPRRIVFGNDGNATPGSFTAWSEDPETGFQYVPVKIFQVNNFNKDPQSMTNPFERFDRGTIVAQFPTLIGEKIQEDTVLSNNKFAIRALDDALLNTNDMSIPTRLVHPIRYIDNSLPEDTPIYPSGFRAQMRKSIKNMIASANNFSNVNIGTLTPIPNRYPIVIDSAGDAVRPQYLSKAPSGLQIEFDKISKAVINDTLRWNGTICMPIRSTKRYGVSYPGIWASGISDTLNNKWKVDQDDRWAPWNFSPHGWLNTSYYTGDGTSVAQMNVRAFMKILSKVNRSNGTLSGQLVQTGLPTKTFDEYAIQDFVEWVPGVFLYAQPNNIITSISTTYGVGGFKTTYNMKSFHSEFGVDAPLGEKTKGLLKNIVHPISWENIPLTTSDENKSEDKIDETSSGGAGGGSGGGGGKKKKKKPKLAVSVNGQRVGANQKLKLRFVGKATKWTKMSDNSTYIKVQNIGGESLTYTLDLSDTASGRFKIIRLSLGIDPNTIIVNPKPGQSIHPLVPIAPTQASFAGAQSIGKVSFKLNKGQWHAWDVGYKGKSTPDPNPAIDDDGWNNGFAEITADSQGDTPVYIPLFGKVC